MRRITALARPECTANAGECTANAGQCRFLSLIMMKLRQAHGKCANSANGAEGQARLPPRQELRKPRSAHRGKASLCYYYYLNF